MIVIVDYDIGNIGSIKNMLRSLGHDAKISRQQSDLETCDRIILPGVGSFDNAMKNLKKYDLITLLSFLTLEKKKPFLGICLGMQLLATHSEEGVLPGLGWIDATVRKFKQEDDPSGAMRIPHMGWKNIAWVENAPLSTGIGQDGRFYFVHSYHVACNDKRDVQGTATYGKTFSAAVRKNNILGVQFHPEKSHRFGKQLLKNFVTQV